MNPSESMHHVFVDFENVQEFDLGPIGDDPVEITILIGAKQKPPKAGLIQELLERACSVRLIKVNASGRNALDFVLACHLGMAAAGDPTGTFHIISRDTDFDPLIAHLHRADLWVDRLHGYSDAPPAKPPRPAVSRTAEPTGAPARRPTAGPRARPATASDQVAIMAQHLEASGPRRPKSKTKLLQVIRNRFGNKPADAEVVKIVDDLIRRGTIEIDARNKVTYPGFQDAP